MKSLDIVLDKLRDATKEHGDVTRFAERAGIPRASVYNWTTEKSDPLLSQLDNIARGLGVTAVEAIGGAPPRALEEALKALSAAEAQLDLVKKMLASVLSISEKTDRILGIKGSPRQRELQGMLLLLDEHQLEAVAQYIEGAVADSQAVGKTKSALGGNRDGA